MLSATIERMTHRSSTRPARCGNSSLTSIPDSPCFGELPGEGAGCRFFVRSSLGFSKGSGLPASAASRGLGSKRIDVRRPAGHEQEDQPLGLGREVRRLERERAGGVGGPGRIRQERSQAEQAEAVGEAGEQFAAVHEVRPSFPAVNSRVSQSTKVVSLAHINK